jgi:hypothetical protein
VSAGPGIGRRAEQGDEGGYCFEQQLADGPLHAVTDTRPACPRSASCTCAMGNASSAIAPRPLSRRSKGLRRQMIRAASSSDDAPAACAAAFDSLTYDDAATTEAAFPLKGRGGRPAAACGRLSHSSWAGPWSGRHSRDQLSSERYSKEQPAILRELRAPASRASLARGSARR